MKIISWNVNGIRSVKKKGFNDFLKEISPDLLCLQEIKAQTIESTADLFNADPSDSFNININCASKKGYSGVAVYSKESPKSVSKELGYDRFDSEGRFLEVVFDNFTLINVYIPHGARDKRNLIYKFEVYSKLTEYLLKKQNTNIVLCGDFNVAMTEADLANPKENFQNTMFTEKERKCIADMVDNKMIDTFRFFNKEGGNYSWWPYAKELRERNVGWRIDYIFVTQSLKEKLISAFILKNVSGSDHCPIGIEVDL